MAYFAEPSGSPVLSVLFAACGYIPIFCLMMQEKRPFLIGFAWFFLLSLIQVSWLTQTTYHGIYILFVYVGIALWLALQFALLAFLIRKSCLAAAGAWTLMEWGRHYVLCGYAFTPMGLPLAALPTSLQCASVVGLLGLGLVVILTNLIGVRALIARSEKQLLLFFVMALSPYVLGGLILSKREAGLAKTDHLSVALVQTGLSADEKIPLSSMAAFIPCDLQWIRIVSALCEGSQDLDLIVLPESALPFGANRPIYPKEWVNSLIPGIPFEKEYASNRDIAHLIAKKWDADVVIGLDDADEKGHYNAAFCVTPFSQSAERYEKQILVPLSEYLPFEGVRSLVARYGITSFFTHGEGDKLLKGRINYAPTICYEECFSRIARTYKRLGGELLVNMTNDAYFPNTSLPRRHFDLGRIGAVEVGLPLVRACNSGVTAAVDSFGRILGRVDGEWTLKALKLEVPLHSYSTLYSQYGDFPIILISITLLCVPFFFSLAQKKTGS